MTRDPAKTCEEADRILGISFTIYTVVIPVVGDDSLLSLQLGEALFPLRALCLKNTPPHKKTIKLLAKMGLLNMLKMITWTESFQSCEIHHAFMAAAAGGHVDVLEWLHATFPELVPSDRMAICEGFISACGNGHLDAAKWWYDALHLTEEDAKSFNNLALWDGCANGHLDVAKWLHGTFHLTKACTLISITCNMTRFSAEIAGWLSQFYV
jgi:hypothetical protein